MRKGKKKGKGVRHFYIEKLEVYFSFPYGCRAILDDAALWGGGGLNLGAYVTEMMHVLQAAIGTGCSSASSANGYYCHRYLVLWW